MSDQSLSVFGEMGLDAVKAKGNWKSEKPKETENKSKKNSNGDDNNKSRNDEEETGEASGCWVKFRFMIGCIPSKSDLDASSSSSIYGSTCTGK